MFSEPGNENSTTECRHGYWFDPDSGYESTQVTEVCLHILLKPGFACKQTSTDAMFRSVQFDVRARAAGGVLHDDSPLRVPVRRVRRQHVVGQVWSTSGSGDVMLRQLVRVLHSVVLAQHDCLHGHRAP